MLKQYMKGLNTIRSLMMIDSTAEKYGATVVDADPMKRLWV